MFVERAVHSEYKAVVRMRSTRFDFRTDKIVSDMMTNSDVPEMRRFAYKGN